MHEKYLKIKNINSNNDTIINGYASIFDFKDHHGDVVKKGAFAKTLDTKKSIKFLWQHDQSSPIGKINKIYEDSKGLYIEASITNGTSKGKEAIDLVKKGIINGLSIGFNIIQSHMLTNGVREITEIDLWEVSLVTFPANGKSELIEVNENISDESNSDPIKSTQISGCSDNHKKNSFSEDNIILTALINLENTIKSLNQHNQLG